MIDLVVIEKRSWGSIQAILVQLMGDKTLKQLILSALFSIILAINPVSATVVNTLGDLDFFGFGVGTIGDPSPAIDFDNRTVGDPAHTDNDIRQAIFGASTLNDVAFSHDLSAQLLGLTATSAELTLAIGGIQDGNLSLVGLDDRLFIEGIEVVGAFDTLDQGAFATALVTFQLSAAQLASFGTDFIVNVFIDGGRISDGAPIGAGALDSYFLDFTTVTVETSAVSAVPLPAALPLFGTGLAIMGFIGWRRKRKLA